MSPVSFTQTQPTPWPSGHGEAVAVVALSPNALSTRYGLGFFEGSDNLDSYDAAAIRLASGRQLGLVRHRGNPSPGTELHTDASDDFVEALREFLDAFELNADSLIWVRREVPVEHLRSSTGASHADSLVGASAPPPPSHSSKSRDFTDPEKLFRENLPWIEKVAGIVCRKNGVWGDEAEDFAAVAKMKLMENDYADLRKFPGDCSPTTYIATLVVRRFHEYARERWGRWRNSAAAEREGQLAKDLETLVHRDGYTLAQAAEQLRSAGKTGLSDTELARVLARLPNRQPLRAKQVGVPLIENEPDVDTADSRIGAMDLDRQRAALLGELFKVMEQLPLEDRQILRLRFADDRSVADVARALRLEQKPLYRRIEQLRAKLRAELERCGVAAEDVRDLLIESNVSAGSSEPEIHLDVRTDELTDQSKASDAPRRMPESGVVPPRRGQRSRHSRRLGVDVRRLHRHDPALSNAVLSRIMALYSAMTHRA
jgi:RNA polymerase sigma factor (sigma-70 family)